MPCSLFLVSFLLPGFPIVWHSHGHGVLPSFHQVTLPLICIVPKRTALHSQETPHVAHKALGQTPELGQRCQVQLPWAKMPPGPPQPMPQQCSGKSEVAFCSFPCIIPNLEAVSECGAGDAKHCPSTSDKAGRGRGPFEVFAKAPPFPTSTSSWRGFVNDGQFTDVLSGGNFVATGIEKQNHP